MAEILNDVVWSADAHTRYPWAEWFDGQARKLVHGTDFASTPANFATAAKQRAKKANLMAKTKVDEDGSVILQAFNADGSTRNGPASLNSDESEPETATETTTDEVQAEPVPAGV